MAIIDPNIPKRTSGYDETGHWAGGIRTAVVVQDPVTGEWHHPMDTYRFPDGTWGISPRTRQKPLPPTNQGGTILPPQAGGNINPQPFQQPIRPFLPKNPFPMPTSINDMKSSVMSLRANNTPMDDLYSDMAYRKANYQPDSIRDTVFRLRGIRV